MSDHKGAQLVLDVLPSAAHLIADRGYDSTGFREALTAKGIEPCIPSSKSRKVPYTTPRWSRLMRGGGCGCVVILSSGLEPEEDGMAAAVPLRPDFDAEALRALAKGSRDL